MDYDLIVVKTLERVYKNYYYIIRGEHMDINLQYFGGRGGSSGIGGGWSNTAPGEKQARFMYNGAKRKTGGEDGYIKNSKMESKLHDIDSGKLTGEQFANSNHWITGVIERECK